MDRLSRLALEWAPIPLTKSGEVVMDVFKHSLSATDGLPPYSQARIIDLISKQLLKARSHPCLWVSVDAPGGWYFNEIRRLVKRIIPMAILPADRDSVSELDFYPYANASYIGDTKYPASNPRFDMKEYNIKESALRILRILARLETAHTTEITSLVGFSETHVRNLLKQLRARCLIEWKRIGKYDGWSIKSNGLRLAHRSWNISKGAHFKQYRGEFRYAGERHRRVSRMWRAWLEAAYPSVDIWECWTEVPVHYGIPDALAWGHNSRHEILFWLEVESGHSSKKIMQRNYARRLETAYFHAKEWKMPIVFCLMGPPWVVECFPHFTPALYPDLAVIGHDWREFGELPVYEFGRWLQDLEATRYRRKHQLRGELPFDPAQYPPKPTKKTQKLSKPKSTKPRYLDQLSAEDGSYWIRDHIEE